MTIFIITQIIFISLKLLNLVAWSWFVTFAPLWSFLSLLLTTLFFGWIAVLIEEINND